MQPKVVVTAPPLPEVKTLHIPGMLSIHVPGMQGTLQDARTFEDLCTNLWAGHFAPTDPNWWRYAQVLQEWADAPRNPAIPRKSMNLRFLSWVELARALRGQVDSGQNRQLEDQMADRIIANNWPRQRLEEYIRGVQVVVDQRFLDEKGRYAYAYSHHSGWFKKVGFCKLSEAIPYFLANNEPVTELAAFCADLGMSVRNAFRNNPTLTRAQRIAPYHNITTQDRNPGQPGYDFRTARQDHWGVDESSSYAWWARQRNIPLGAGPSATTMQALAVADYLYNHQLPAVLRTQMQGDYRDVRIALAWGLFAFWNKAGNTRLGTYRGNIHTFHEVMMIAKHYGVPYTDLCYPDDAPRCIDTVFPNLVYPSRFYNMVGERS
jgi:hypothetical protein